MYNLTMRVTYKKNESVLIDIDKRDEMLAHLKDITNGQAGELYFGSQDLSVYYAGWGEEIIISAEHVNPFYYSITGIEAYVDKLVERGYVVAVKTAPTNTILYIRDRLYDELTKFLIQNGKYEYDSDKMVELHREVFGIL